MQSGEHGKVLCHLPVANYGSARGFAPGSSLLLCVPRVIDPSGWAGSKMSVLNIDSEEEVPWSAYLPLIFGDDHILFFTAGWAAVGAGSRDCILHAVVGSELRLVDTVDFATALDDGALLPIQILELTRSWPAQVSVLLKKLPHLVNIREKATGDTIFHLCAREGNVKALQCLFGNRAVTYTPVPNFPSPTHPNGVTALDLAIHSQYLDVAKELWQRLTPSLNELTAFRMNDTLALLASKRTTAMLVLPFLSDAAGALQRELVSFRTTFRTPIACVLPTLTLSQQHKVNAAGDTNDQTIELWRDVRLQNSSTDRVPHQGLPLFDTDDVAPVSSKVVLLPNLAGDPQHMPPHQRAFHLIVEHCNASAFENDIIKLTVDFKWKMNVVSTQTQSNSSPMPFAHTSDH